MASLQPLLLLLLLLLSGATGDDLSLPAAEQEAAYLALESINPTTDWRSLYSGDLCDSGPHGVVCDTFINGNSSEIHIVELNFGFVAETSPNPNCSSDAALPSSVSSLRFLRKIFFYSCFVSSKTTLSSNFLNALPAESMEEVAFINNPSLVGRVPAAIGNFSKLRRLILTNTAVSGSIPASVGGLRSLNQLILSRNRIRGPMPAAIGDLGMLVILDLSGNRISGSVPPQIGGLVELIKLDLSTNRISGQVPVQLGRLKKVEFLDLSFNRLTGGVPAAIGEMTRLKEVYLSGNALGGEIPEIWGNLRGILGIGMSGVGLVGNIPVSMGVFLESIRYLGLDGNFLEGELPEEFKRLEMTAGEINVENNRLRGRIPFSARFVGRLGGRLKVGGNDKLCLGEELVGHVRGMGSVGALEECNKMEIPLSAHTSSGASLLKGGPILGILGILVLLCWGVC